MVTRGKRSVATTKPYVDSVGKVWVSLAIAISSGVISLILNYQNLMTLFQVSVM